MNKVIGVSLFVIGGGIWFIGTQFSTETTALIIGLVLGMIAGLPVSLLVLAATRRNDRSQPTQPQYPQYPPIVLMGGQQHQQGVDNFVPPPPTINIPSRQLPDQHTEW